MIYKVESFCQITENSPNMHFWYLNVTFYCDWAFSVDILLLKSYYSETNMLLVYMWWLNLLYVAFSNILSNS